MTKGLNTIAAEAGELKATISHLATALTNNEQAHTRLTADMEAAQTKLKALQQASVAAFDELAAIAERREPEAAVAPPMGGPLGPGSFNKYAFNKYVRSAETAELGRTNG